jgi:hypothetical protein
VLAIPKKFSLPDLPGGEVEFGDGFVVIGRRPMDSTVLTHVLHGGKSYCKTGVNTSLT